MIFSCLHLYSQGELRFYYDGSGNQIYRGAVTNNQTDKTAEVLEPMDEVIEKDLTEPERLDEEQHIFIAASPNPVTHQLYVRWENTTNQHFIRLDVFSYHNQHLLERDFSESLQSLELDFSTYPQGMYFLIFTRDKFTTQTYKINKR